MNRKGITLIAFVITIIVLLILAGISISMLTGNNAILKRAGDARDKTGVKGLKEETQMVLMGRKINSSTGIENKTLKEELESEINGSEVEEIDGISDVCYVKRKNEYVTVYENGEIEEGKIEIWDGQTIKCPEIRKENNIWNWYISKPSELKFLADFVNNGDGNTLPEELNGYVQDAGYNLEDVKMTIDTTIYLMSDLDLGARQKNGTKIAGIEWTPIGITSSNVFHKLGTFKGNNHIIKGVYINRTQGYNGIFGYSNTIEGLTIKDSYIRGGGATGGIVGNLIGGKIENCHNKNSTVILEVKSNNSVGGIVGTSNIYGLYIKNCSNTGSVIGKGDCVGGIIGSEKSLGSIIECTNNGIIEGNESSIGGITGYSIGQIIKCTNNGKIIGKGNFIGGILGYGNNEGITSECTNNGEVIGNDSSIGGIAGMMNQTHTLSRCVNNGTITGEMNFIGGISGRTYSGTISECINTGLVKGKKNAIGGITGNVGWNDEASGTINNCYNIGKIISENNNNNLIGGVVGYIVNGEVKYNYSIGEIEIKGTGITKIGGAIGLNKGTESNNYYLAEKSNVTFDSTFGEEKDSEYMKGIEFLNKLNEEQSPEVWEYRIGENNGFPVLIKIEE